MHLPIGSPDSAPSRSGLARFASTLILFLVLSLFLGCSGGTGEKPKKSSDPKSKPGGRAETWEKGQRPPSPPIPVAIERSARGTIASYYEANASLDANREAEILARVSGLVLGLEAEEGDRVARGQSLLRVEPDSYALRVRQAEAEAAKQATRFTRLQKMFDQNLVSVEEYEAAQNDNEAAAAALELARLDLSHTNVVAPFAGCVTHRYVDAGQTVNSGTPLFRLADLSQLLARVHVPAKEFGALKSDQPVELFLDGGRRSLSGRITLISPVIDPSTGTIKVTVAIPSPPADVRPGDFASVRIVTERHSNTLLVPKSSVISEKGERIVYVARDSIAERRTVTVGFEDRDHSEILAGLAPGEPVVVQGQRSLKHGAPIRILPATRFDRVGAPDSPAPAPSETDTLKAEGGAPDSLGRPGGWEKHRPPPGSRHPGGKRSGGRRGKGR